SPPVTLIENASVRFRQLGKELQRTDDANLARDLDEHRRVPLLRAGAAGNSINLDGKPAALATTARPLCAGARTSSALLRERIGNSHFARPWAQRLRWARVGQDDRSAGDQASGHRPSSNRLRSL